MSLTSTKGIVPRNVAQLMEKRLSFRDSDEIGRFYKDNLFVTGDGVAVHPDGRFKSDLDSKHLRNVSRKTVTNKNPHINDKIVFQLNA